MGKELDIYCETCEELICLHCTVRLHQREGHKFDLVSDVFSKHKDELVSCLKPVEEQLSSAAKFTESLGILTDQEAAIEADIRENIRQLHKALEVRESELIGQLGQMTQQKLKTLETQRPQLELIQARLNSCHDFVNKSLQTGNQAEILKMKKLIMKQIKQTIAESADFKPETEDMKFVTADLTQMVQQFGQIYSHSVHPENCYATGKGLEVAVAQEHNTVTLHIIDAKGQACEEPLPLAAIFCELDSVSHIKCAKKEGNKYELSYQPTRIGQHQLHVRVEGKHIKGSPFPVTIVKSLTTPTGSIKDLQKPYGITVNQNGQIMVTERHHISVFSPNGEKYKTFGECGSDDGQFMFPHGVAMDRNGNILVADGRNHRIQKLTADGQFPESVGKRGKQHFEFNNPTGIAVHPQNSKVYVCDDFNYRIQVLNEDLTFFNSFGSEGYDEKEFQYPFGVAFDSTGNVYVTDSLNHCIKVFTAEGKFQRIIERKGEVDSTEMGEKPKWPTGICIDSNDIMYVTEEDNHCVSVFTCQGQFISSFGTKGTKPGQFSKPLGIAVNENGLVYVCEQGNCRVQIF